MEVKYLNAPMYYINNTPAYKTGEWYGHKSCKFGPTRRIIRPIQKENPLLTGLSGIPEIMPRKRHIEIKPTQEQTFKPSCKLVNETYLKKNKNRIESTRKIEPIFTQNKERVEKRHNFEYLKQRDLAIKTKLNDTIEKNIKQEFKNISKIGLVKSKDYYNIIKNNRFSKNFKLESYIPHEKVLGKEITNLKEDIYYVKSLNNKLPNI